MREDEMQKTVLITGGGRGIGAAIGARLGAAGLSVVVSDIDRELAEAAALELRRRGVDAAGLACDVSDELAVGLMFEQVQQRFGPIWALVNNAALTDVHRPWTSVSPSQWRRVVEVNLTGAFICAREAAKHMQTLGAGRIVNIGSVTAYTGKHDLVDYATSKAGLTGLTRTLARALGPHSITVNLVVPGAIATEAEQTLFPDRAQLDREMMGLQCIQRRGQPADVAGVVEFFVGDSSSFVTGQSLIVDGGWIFD